MSEYDRIKRRLLLTPGRLFEDPEFPASPYSIRSDGRVPWNVRWLRPKDIVRQPLFIRDGATRFDLDQGQLGDCWFIAAASSLALANRRLLERCVPMNQTFSEDYCGIFRFNFWSFDSWVEVVIDDRLPTINGRLLYASNVEEPDEFWAALLEKAYAKLYKRYENINGGHINDALVDFTGGISEVINLQKPETVPDDLFEIMFRTLKMNSMVGCSIDGTAAREVDLGNGLYTGHAYAINNLVQANINGRRVRLIRLRNPWGRKEWRGAWSDGSKEWNSLSEKDRKSIGYTERVDGEFWMEFDEWRSCFHKVNFCHLYPDGLTAEVAKDTHKRDWEATVVHDSWVRGFSAGGCGNAPHRDLFWTNPQIAFKLNRRDDEDEDGKNTVVISLMQKAEEMQYEELYIGIMVYKLRSSSPVRMDGEKYGPRDVRMAAPPNAITNLREVTVRLDLSPGVYVAIPCTFYPHKEGDFLVRLYTESKTEAASIEEETSIHVPEPPEQPTEDFFKKHSGGDINMDAYELRNALNDIFRADLTRGFDIEACRSILAMMDTNGSGYLRPSEFKPMLRELEFWKDAFYKYDKNRAGNIDTNELASLFKDVGFHLSRSLLSGFVKRYGGKKRIIHIEDFILCCTRVIVMYRRFIHHSKSGVNGKAEVTLEQWLRETMLY